jgi:hypothetical protein
MPLSVMYFPSRCRKNLISALLFFLSLTLAQPDAQETIYSLDVYASQKPCAQGCFVYYQNGCQTDAVAGAIGCQNYCNSMAPNYCYCRSDLQLIAQSYITACVKDGCTVGDSSIDISSAGSIYNYYCSSQGFPAAAIVTTTTQEVTSTTNGVTSTAQEGTQATTTVYVSIHSSSGVSTNGLVYSTVMKIRRLFFSVWS